MRLQLDSSTLAAGELHGTAPAELSSQRGPALRSGSAGSDQIRISGPAEILSRSAAERTARIARLTELVHSGSYQPLSSDIAKAILDGAHS